MKQCSRCGQPYEEILPFCLKCEEYEAISCVIIGKYQEIPVRDVPQETRTDDVAGEEAMSYSIKFQMVEHP
ncbi:hypothetical protein JJC00_06595 [Bradyrhizobium diazoefficiens]|uniref:hypothetical protein n=1 Tax=Bradyrhizobium diazoefficiens TaxID=1355477 RepID=UPI00190C464C|nr:hypothetical protein [Bradyrhizobium diazoefficiens]QQO35347.1 hypothetical protein JJC00_06595 [Bradyrhizobium diazoefficiens]